MNIATRPRREPIVSARDIVNRFGKQEVHDKINLDVMPGEILGIAGIVLQGHSNDPHRPRPQRIGPIERHGGRFGPCRRRIEPGLERDPQQ